MSRVSNGSNVSSVSNLRVFPPALPGHQLPTEDPVNQFLKHVVCGAQSDAEEELKSNPQLASLPGNCTDHAGRQFKNITGFQYALWARDSHMWKMIKPYLHEGEAKIQCQNQAKVTKASGHGEIYKYQALLAALKEYTDMRMHRWDDERYTQRYLKTEAISKNKKTLQQLWIGKVGGEQKRATAIVANIYYLTAKDFQNFLDGIEMSSRLSLTKSAWWSARSDEFGILGDENSNMEAITGFAFYRSSDSKLVMSQHADPVHWMIVDPYRMNPKLGNAEADFNLLTLFFKYEEAELAKLKGSFLSIESDKVGRRSVSCSIM